VYALVIFTKAIIIQQHKESLRLRRGVPMARRSSSNRATENDIADAALKVLAEIPNGAAPIEVLKQQIPKYLKLSTADLARSKTRPREATWEQKMRAIKSHCKSPGNFICEGYLGQIKGGLHITEAGRRRLKQNNYHIGREAFPTDENVPERESM
jgi:hypothetical protein